MTNTTTTSGSADRAIEGCPELNMGNYDEVGVERLNDWAIRANDEIDRLHTQSEMRRAALLDEMQKAALAAGQAAAAQADSVLNDTCHAPPIGWRCTRKAGHEGPCAAVEYEDDKLFVDRGMQRIRDAADAAQKEGE